MGGDGTAAELVNRTVPGLPLTVFPAGNENLLARHFGLGPTPEECCRVVKEGAVARRDAGRAGSRIFLIMIGCGFDADVVQAMHMQRTGHVTSASYFNPIMASIRHYDYPELRVYWNEDGVAEPGVASAAEPAAESISEGVRWLFAFNLPCYGAGLQIAPEADGSDGLLDVCTFRHGGLWRGLYYTAAVLTGTHRWLPDFAGTGRPAPRHLGVPSAVSVGRRPRWFFTRGDRSPAQAADVDRSWSFSVNLQQRKAAT